MATTNFSISQVESPVYTASTTGSDTYTATLVPTPTSLVTGQKVRIKFTTANTGACSLNLNSLGAVNIKTRAGNNPADGDIAADSIRELIYDGTNFVLTYNQSTTAEPGNVEMATDGEATAGTDETRYVNSKQLITNVRLQKMTSGTSTGVITGVGFKPKTIHVFVGNSFFSGSTKYQSSNGIVEIDSGGTIAQTCSYVSTNNSVNGINTTSCGYIADTDGIGGTSTITITAVSSDGMTFSATNGYGSSFKWIATA